MHLYLVLMLVVVCFRRAVESKNCYSCTGENCVKTSTANNIITCTNENDLCITRFDATSLLAVERGCLLQTDVTTCTGNECVSCDTGDLCNDAGHPLHRCAVCSSLETPDCTSNAGSLEEFQCVAATLVDLTAAQCYSRVIGFVTERGCITSQSEVDRCTEVNCSMCVGTGCNKVEFPANRQQCVTCENSDTCDTDTTTSEFCDDPYDACVILKRANGATKKSCEKSLTSNDATYCQSNPAQCAFCGQKLCNSVPFSASNSMAGNKMRCFQCESTGCLQSRVKLVTCRQFDDECYSLFSGFNPTRRGCTSDRPDELRVCRAADASNPECAICSESECNLESRSDHRCLYCSSVMDASCIAPATGTFTPVQCSAPSTEILPDAQCFIKVIGSTTERGCVSAASDLLGCSNDDRNCVTCSIEDGGEGCNKQIFPTDRRRCSVGSTANTYCPDPQDDCVQLLQSGIRKRTCRSLMTTTEHAFCNVTSNRCQFCSTDNCNAETVSFDFVHCLTCDSSTDTRCATNPSAITTFSQCATCAMAIVDGNVRRGCLASMPLTVAALCSTTAGAISCQRCSTNRCNTGNFPVSRQQCYRCTKPPCVSHQSIRLEYCPVYRANDTCMQQTDASGQLLRLECSSSLTEAELSVCSASAALCHTCSSAGCNDPMAYGTSGSCVQCRSGLNPLCREQAGSVQSQPCSNPTNAVCYSRMVDIGASVGATERGCITDLTATEQISCTRGENCIVCDSRISNCNTAQYPVAPLKCFQCDSRTVGISCQEFQSGTAIECPIYDTENKCYTIVQANGDTIRKCSTAARETECASISRCEVCLFSGCNNKASSNVGTMVTPVITTTPRPKNGAGTIIVWRCLALANLGIVVLIAKIGR